MPAIEDKFLKPPVRFPPNLVVSRWLDYAELPHGPEQVYSPQSSAMRHNPNYGIMLDFMGLQVIGLLVVFFFPPIALWLPDLLFGR